MVEDVNHNRSQANSQGSQRLTSRLTGGSDSALDEGQYGMYILKPSEVSELWEAEDPN